VDIASMGIKNTWKKRSYTKAAGKVMAQAMERK